MYGKIPNFQNQCGEYEFSNEVKINSNKLLQEGIKERRFINILILICIIALIGMMFHEYTELWLQILIYGITSLFLTIFRHFKP